MPTDIYAGRIAIMKCDHIAAGIYEVYCFVDSERGAAIADPINSIIIVRAVCAD